MHASRMAGIKEGQRGAGASSKIPGVLQLMGCHRGSPSSVLSRRGHEASPGRSQAAAGHRHWKGNHRDERKRSSQGGVKLWPEKAAAVAGPTQTCGAPSGHMLRAPGKGTYLQEHPLLLTAFEERS